VILRSVKTAKWIGDCFIYTSASNRLNYLVGTESYTISPFDTFVFDPPPLSLPPNI
jgi:coatomer subunit beta'